MLTKTRAIVLHSTKFGESQMIVDLFTEQYGRLSFICRLPKTNKGKIKKQLFQPLTLLDIELQYRQQVRLQHLRDVRIAQPFIDIPFDPYKLSITLFLAEFLYYCTRDEQTNIPLFQYMENSIQWLDSTNSSFANFHLVFMMRLSRFIGFFPNLEDHQPGDYFDLRNGCFSSVSPIHPDFIRPDEAEKIGMLMRLNYETMRLFTMSREERNRCVEVILHYYRLHVPNFPELKSLPVLQELFA